MICCHIFRVVCFIHTVINIHFYICDGNVVRHIKAQETHFYLWAEQVLLTSPTLMTKNSCKVSHMVELDNVLV